jgi:NADH:ubiquinone oxidoreductase subunit D
VNKIQVEIGYLHRGTEKLIEYKTYSQNVSYFDRLDYVSTINCEFLFYQFQTLMNSTQNNNNKFNSVNVIILVELARVSNHLLAITTHLMDTGALSPFLWAFEVREIIFEIFEEISGGRMHTN